MGLTDPAGSDPTRSLLTIDLNCPWCLNATVEALEADPPRDGGQGPQRRRMP